MARHQVRGTCCAMYAQHSDCTTFDSALTQEAATQVRGQQSSKEWEPQVGELQLLPHTHTLIVLPQLAGGSSSGQGAAGAEQQQTGAAGRWGGQGCTSLRDAMHTFSVLTIATQLAGGSSSGQGAAGADQQQTGAAGRWGGQGCTSLRDAMHTF